MSDPDSQKKQKQYEQHKRIVKKWEKEFKAKHRRIPSRVKNNLFGCPIFAILNHFLFLLQILIVYFFSIARFQRSRARGTQVIQYILENEDKRFGQFNCFGRRR